MRAPGFLTRRPRHPAPAPTFTPLPGSVRATAPIRLPASPVPAGRHTAPGRIRVARTARAAIEQALRGIERIDFRALDAAKAREGLTHAGTRPADVDPLTAPDWPAADPAASRADQFIADMRMAKRGGLPLFRQVAREVGWRGLNEERPAPGPALGRPGRLDDWEADSRNLIAAWVKTARIEIDGTCEALARREAQFRAEADAAFGLGHRASAA